MIKTILFLWTSTLSCVAVKVLLNEDARGVIKINSKCGFTLHDGKTRDKIAQPHPCAEITLSLKQDGFYLNGKRDKDRQSIILKPVNKHFSFEAKEYDGYLLVMLYNKRWHVINVLDSEDYVCSVLKTEGWPGWPLEVYKVLAIAVRTYVLHHYFEAKKMKLPYYVTNTNYHQTYSGVHSCPIIKKAVEETKDIILVYDNKPILAMFDACCGGVVPAHIENVVDFAKAPYLARPYPCTFCRGYKVYSWTNEYTLEKLRDLLQEGHNSILHDLHEVKIHETDKAGLVKTVVTKTKGKQTIHFVSSIFNRLVKNLRSLFYSIEQKGSKIVVKGRGYGHHLGLCQWGTREMVKQGWDCDEILEFFYPGVTFHRLENNKIT